MFYEGTEKRLEIIVKQHNLLQLPTHFWQEMVTQAGANILSRIENAQVRAYLLSESSLFIWQDRLLLITCGNTHLVKAAQFFQKSFAKEQLQALLFQRHQAIQPTLQPSNFNQDITILNSQLQGMTQHWREDYQGDLFFFGKLDKHPLNNKQILMLHGLSGDFAMQLQAGSASTELIATTLGLQELLPQLLIDQFTFTPKGYSLNAISERDYLTIHITPEQQSTYLSLESSFQAPTIQPLIDHLLRLFSPSRNQLMHFNKGAKGQLTVSVQEL